MNDHRQPSRGADLVALAQATHADGSVDLTAYQARRLILSHQTLDGLDTSAMARELANSPVLRTPGGSEQIDALLDAIRRELGDTDRQRFDRSLHAFDVGESPIRRFAEDRILDPVASAWASISGAPAQVHEQISDQLAEANRWAERVRDDPDNAYWQRAMAGAASGRIEETQGQYGLLTGAARQGMNMLGEVVDLAQFGYRFSTDPHFRDLIVGAAGLYLEETARDPMRPVRDVEQAASNAWTQWQKDFSQARREGREAEFLGETGGAVGVELLAAVLPPLKLAKLGLLVRAVDGAEDLTPSRPGTPGPGGVLDEMLDLGRQAQRRGGDSDANADLMFNGLAGVRRSQGELQDLVNDLRRTGDLDGLLRSGALTPRELGFLARQDVGTFDGEVSFEQSLNAWARHHAKDGLTNQQTGEVAEAIVAHQMMRDGYRDLTPIQNNSGHGNDLVGFNTNSGRWEVVEVKGSIVGRAAAQSGDPFPTIITRLERAAEGRGHWDPKNMWEEAAAPTARRVLDDAVDPETGRIHLDARWARVNIVQGADGALTFPPRIELDPWTPRQTRASTIDGPDGLRDHDHAGPERMLARLSDTQAATHSRALEVASADGRWTAQECRNIAACALCATAENPTVQRADDVGIYNGRMFVSYFPFGRNQEPIFNAHIDPEHAAQIPARDSLHKAQQIEEQRNVALAQQQAAPSQTNDPAGPSISARVLS